jgi:hypothetical protein
MISHATSIVLTVEKLNDPQVESSTNNPLKPVITDPAGRESIESPQSIYFAAKTL